MFGKIIDIPNQRASALVSLQENSSVIDGSWSYSNGTLIYSVNIYFIWYFSTFYLEQFTLFFEKNIIKL